MRATEQSFAWLFRVALFAAAASLAAYIPYRYATLLHAVSGLYAFLFPLLALLAAAGLILAVKPAKACDCGATLRTSVAALAGIWLATGLLCVGTLFFGAKIENRAMADWGTPPALAGAQPGSLAHDHYATKGTIILVLVFLACFAVYYFANWKALADVWPVR